MVVGAGDAGGRVASIEEELRGDLRESEVSSLRMGLFTVLKDAVGDEGVAAPVIGTGVNFDNSSTCCCAIEGEMREWLFQTEVNTLAKRSR